MRTVMSRGDHAASIARGSSDSMDANLSLQLMCLTDSSSLALPVPRHHRRHLADDSRVVRRLRVARGGSRLGQEWCGKVRHQAVAVYRIGAGAVRHDVEIPYTATRV